MGYNIIDVIVVVALAVFTVFGLKKGFVGNLVGFISLIASVILAWILYPVIADMLMGLGIRDYVYNIVLQKINPDSALNLEMIPEFLQSSVKSGTEAAAIQVTSSITDIILNILAFLIVLIVSRIIIFVAEKVLKIAVKLPILNGINRLLGALTGLLKGVIIIYIIGMIAFMVYPVGKENNMVKDSYFVEKMYNNNPVVNSIIKEEQLKIEQNGEL